MKETKMTSGRQVTFSFFFFNEEYTTYLYSISVKVPLVCSKAIRVKVLNSTPENLHSTWGKWYVPT